MTFSAWKIKFLNPMTFQVFHDLYELYTCVIESDFTWDSSTLQQRWVIIMYVNIYFPGKQRMLSWFRSEYKKHPDFNTAVLVNLALSLLCSWIPSWTISMFVLNWFLLPLNFALLLYAIKFFPFTFSLLQGLWAWHSSARHMTVFNKNLTISATGLEKGQTKSIISTAFLVLGYKITHIVLSVQNVLCHCITVLLSPIISIHLF